MEKIVKNKPMDYAELSLYINELKFKYPSLRVATCGKSFFGRDIYALVMGEGEKNVLYVGGTHGIEWITSVLLMNFCEDVLSRKEISGYDIAKLLKENRLIIIPELNPDGIEIAIKGKEGWGDNCKNSCSFGTDFTRWSANGRGVDINHNFNAGWYDLRDYEESHGTVAPGARRFGGEYPESEPETKAITRFLRAVDVDMLITFHAQGKEIYYEYGKNTPERSLWIARIFSELSGYTLVKNEGHCMGGGLKDWYIEEMKKPAFTIEVGKGKNPLPLSNSDEIYEDILPILIMGMIL